MGLFEWIIDNKEWLFSGAGIVALAALWRLVFRRKVREATIARPAVVGTSAAFTEPTASPPEPVPPHWQGIAPDDSRYALETVTSDSIPLGKQTFAFEYGRKGHAKPLVIGGKEYDALVQFTCHITNPYLALYQANTYALNVLQPKFLTATRTALERAGVSKIRRDSALVEKSIVEALSADFAELGVQLDQVVIGAVLRSEKSRQ
jgi:hypothetical protein